MRGRGRRVHVPRFVASGRENSTPRVVFADVKPKKGLSECAEEVADVIGRKIDESQKRIDEMLSEIARAQNEVQKKRLGFRTALKCKKDEMALKHHQMIEGIQSTTSVQLAENEKIAARIAELAEEIEGYSNPKPVDVKPVGNIDLSAKTNRILKEREEEMRSKCSLEFQPFLERLEEQHRQNIESLHAQHLAELQQVDDEYKSMIDGFAPKAYITKEEMRLRQSYEMIIQKEKKTFEETRDDLKARIKQTETERDREMQRITDETDEEIFQGEQMLSEKIEEIRGLVVEPVIEEIPLHFELSPEQEREYREKIELSLKSNFEKQLQRSVCEVAERRERMEREMHEYCENKMIQAEEQSQATIAELRYEINNIQNEIKESHDLINSMKAEWNDMNHSRRDNEEMLQRMQDRSTAMSDRLAQLNIELAQLTQTEDEDDTEADQVQSDIDRLASDVASERRHHVHFMKRSAVAHDESITQVKSRVIAVKQGKDELIARLKGQIRETNRRSKSLRQDLERKMAQYRA